MRVLVGLQHSRFNPPSGNVSKLACKGYRGVFSARRFLHSMHLKSNGTHVRKREERTRGRQREREREREGERRWKRGDQGKKSE